MVLAQRVGATHSVTAASYDPARNRFAVTWQENDTLNPPVNKLRELNADGTPAAGALTMPLGLTGDTTRLESVFLLPTTNGFNALVSIRELSANGGFAPAGILEVVTTATVASQPRVLLDNAIVAEQVHRDTDGVAYFSVDPDGPAQSLVQVARYDPATATFTASVGSFTTPSFVIEAFRCPQKTASWPSSATPMSEMF